MKDWKPIQKKELDAILESQASDLPEQAKVAWNRFRCVPTKANIIRSKEEGIEQVFIVAREKNFVLCFDDVEDEFAIGTLDSRGFVPHFGLVGDLDSAISIFGSQTKKRSSDSTSDGIYQPADWSPKPSV